MKQLFIVERDVVFSAHASCDARKGLAGKCLKRLSRMRGPNGSQCNMFVEAHPEPAPWTEAIHPFLNGIQCNTAIRDMRLLMQYGTVVLCPGLPQLVRSVLTQL